MRLPFVAIALVLISLTNFVVLPLDGMAPITAFILFAPALLLIAVKRSLSSWPRLEEPVCYLPLLYFLGAAVLNAGQTRWSSLAYSLLYLAFFLALNRCELPRHLLATLAKCIIAAYLVNVAAAQLIYLLFGDLGTIQWLFQGTYDPKTEAMRFHGFSSEPSYAGFVVVVALIVYSRLSQDPPGVRLLCYGAVLYLIASFSSIYGYLLLAAFALDWLVRRRVISAAAVAALAAAVAVLGVVLGGMLLRGDGRVTQLLLFLLSGGWNLEEFRAVDGSAFMRVGPLVLYLTGMDPGSYQTYLGHGPGAAARYFGAAFSDAIGADSKSFQSETMNLGFFPGFLYDYGLLGGMVVLLVVLRRGVSGLLSLEAAVFLLLLPNASFNTQLFWYVWGMFHLMNRCSTEERPLAEAAGNRAQAVAA